MSKDGACKDDCKFDLLMMMMMMMMIMIMGSISYRGRWFSQQCRICMSPVSAEFQPDIPSLDSSALLAKPVNPTARGAHASAHTIQGQPVWTTFGIQGTETPYRTTVCFLNPLVAYSTGPSLGVARRPTSLSNCSIKASKACPRSISAQFGSKASSEIYRR
jgi:hypothetical protein